MKLNFKTFGEGEPLIILHGLLGSLDNWQTLAKQFSAHCTVFVVDQRNHGKSPHAPNFDYDILADDLFDFMDENYISSAHILGHSMGGKTAMYFAMKYPEKVEKLIVADIAPVKYEEGHKVIFDALFSVDLKAVDNRKEIDEQLKKQIPQFGVRQFLMKGLTRNDDRALAWKFNLIDIWNNYDNILETFETEDVFEGETLFIKGEQSAYIIDKYIPVIKKYFPASILKTIKRVGHWLHAEKPKEFYEIVIKFLKK